MLTDSLRIVTHDFPAWREKANFIIASRLGEELGIDDIFDWEQLWGRSISENTFELCCIPFFAYNLALGDIVETCPFESRTFVVKRLLESRGHKTFRLVFRDLDNWATIVDEIRTIGCLVEPRWNLSKVIAIDASTPEHISDLERYLEGLGSGASWEIAN